MGKPCFGKVNMFRTVLLLISEMLRVVLSLSIACVGGLLDQALKSLFCIAIIQDGEVDRDKRRRQSHEADGGAIGGARIGY